MARSLAKRILALSALAAGGRSAAGATLLTYHRVGGGTVDELDLPVAAFAAQLDVLVAGAHDVVSLDVALDRLDAGDHRPSVVLTFDDGFADLFRHAFPLLTERGLPFTLYLAAGLVGGAMTWEGSTAKSQGEPALSWDQVGAMHESGLCTVANHTLTHAGPSSVDLYEIDRCSGAVEERLGIRPSHFAWTWGVPVPVLLPALRERFRSAATGQLGRNPPDVDRLSLKRIPVRRSDPLSFFQAKLTTLGPERAYGGIIRATKAARRVLHRG